MTSPHLSPSISSKLSLKFLTFTATLALVALAGCHKKPKALPPDANAPTASTSAAPTASITADPLAIDIGASIVLNWRTTNATSVSIDGIGEVPLNGTQTVSPANSTNFHLVAKGDGGVTEANVRVTVRVPEPYVMPADKNTAANANGSDGPMGSEAAFHAAVKDIFFDYDSFDLSADAQTNISNAAHYLAAHPAIKLVIGGYCDDRGSAEYNITLGEDRATSAKTALVEAGVAAARIRVISFGKEKQFCTEENDSCWQQNRRAQFTLDK